MLKDITIGQHFPGDSSIHKLDPRVKILLTILYIVSLFVINNFYGYGIIIAFTFLVIFITKIPLKFIIKGLKPILWIIVFTAILNLFLTPGEILYKLGPLKITEEGLYRSIFMILRLTFLIIGTSILTLTTSPIVLTDGIEKLLSPFKRIGLPAHEIAMMMTIALRFIPTLIEETDKIMKAQMARGADFQTGSILRRAKSLVPILVPLFVSSFRRAEELATAMESRCYRGGEGRTRLKQLYINKNDVIASISMMILFGVLLFSRTL